MSEKNKKPIVALVREKYNQALQTDGCVVRSQRRGKPVEQVQLIDPSSDTRHAIQRQMQSHIVETSRREPITTPIGRSIGFIMDPQKLLVDNSGDVQLISARTTHRLSEECLESTLESLKKSEPFPVSSIGAISAANSIKSFDESLAELLSSKSRTLQERAQILLRSGFTSRRYCEIDWVQVDDELFPELSNGFRVVRARFSTEDFGVTGTVSNVIDNTSRTLSTDSVELGLEFGSERLLSTLDGDVFGSEFDLSIEGNEAIIAAATPAGLTNLAAESLAQISEIVDVATLVPVRSK